MKNKEQIFKEAKEIYFAIRQIIELNKLNTIKTDYCQSWWLNTRNFNLKSGLKTSQINQRAKLLVKQGYLIVDRSMTSTSTGTCYKLTKKELK
jgi:hypothetical protein